MFTILILVLILNSFLLWNSDLVKFSDCDLLDVQEPQLRTKPWLGVWDATRPGSVCLQYDHMTYLKDEPIIGDEDCLYVNVYTPEVSLFICYWEVKIWTNNIS